jgi:hypothetical protein
LQVLRSYDSRFRQTNRSSEIYLSPDCRAVVGGETTVVVQFPAEEDAAASPNDESFWAKSSASKLLIIAVRYKDGGHAAKTPRAFLPVIDQLGILHRAGFVHGDIRGFNTVFGGERDGGLIDFDFGGKPGRRYPKGYRSVLADGHRSGGGEDEDRDNTLAYWHDWYALGRLIFQVHNFKSPAGDGHGVKSSSTTLQFRLYETDQQWRQLESDPTHNDIMALRSLLGDLEEQNWTVSPDYLFMKELEMTGAPPMATFRGATGSPPDKRK